MVSLDTILNLLSEEPPARPAHPVGTSRARAAPSRISFTSSETQEILGSHQYCLAYNLLYETDHYKSSFAGGKQHERTVPIRGRGRIRMKTEEKDAR